MTQSASRRTGPIESKDLRRLLPNLPVGRRRVALALIEDPGSRTYREVATKLGLNRGTVSEHLRRIRLHHPQVYQAIMRLGSRQLAGRHERAVARAQEHSKRWHEMTGGRYLPFPLHRYRLQTP